MSGLMPRPAGFVLGRPPSSRWLVRGMLVEGEFGSLPAHCALKPLAFSQLQSIVFLAATVNATGATCVGGGAVPPTEVGHLAVHGPQGGPGCRNDKAGR